MASTASTIFPPQATANHTADSDDDSDDDSGELFPRSLCFAIAVCQARGGKCKKEVKKEVLSPMNHNVGICDGHLHDGQKAMFKYCTKSPKEIVFRQSVDFVEGLGKKLGKELERKRDSQNLVVELNGITVLRSDGTLEKDWKVSNLNEEDWDLIACGCILVKKSNYNPFTGITTTTRKKIPISDFCKQNNLKENVVTKAIVQKLMESYEVTDDEAKGILSDELRKIYGFQ